MDSYQLPQFNRDIHIALLKNVSNASQIRSRIIIAASIPSPQGDAEREAINFAFIDPRLLTSALHIKTAIYQALLNEHQASLRTKSVHSEILWALNPNNNITEAIRRFGVSDSCTSLLIVRISSPDLNDVEAKIKSIVSGDIVPLSQLETLTDWATIKKYYKLNGEPVLEEVAGDTQRERAVLDNIVVSSVAMKTVMQ
ncbi:hypothetical protein JAAARDRAFT_28791 [Jaapia argillacea MUCL 33604]|uniref:EKC/KEOPS complex subunit CGI121 n=1 Tax=Jaapia argillacea MUCL 33604 TaxID=933084 RepID=A0A067QDW3_9AGAM|nr:hypothetical protein JAAARDRAFT_28791 [Jaapia argillacea MUCL 33604]